jgi:hypothetical protein
LIKIINLFFALIICIANIYFTPFTYNIIKTSGGGFGYGLMALPFLLLMHLFGLPAIYSLLKNYANHSLLMMFNTIGFCCLMA